MRVAYRNQIEEHLSDERYRVVAGAGSVRGRDRGVSHAGLALLRRLSDVTGLTGGLSGALASRRLLVHDRGGVLAGLACAIADGAQVITDFRIMGDQAGLFGPVASVPTLWRA